MEELINYQYSLNIDEKQYKIVKDKIFNHGRLGRVTLRRNTGRGYPPIPRNCKGIRKRVSSLPKREIMDVYERSHKAVGYLKYPSSVTFSVRRANVTHSKGKINTTNR